MLVSFRIAIDHRLSQQTWLSLRDDKYRSTMLRILYPPSKSEADMSMQSSKYVPQICRYLSNVGVANVEE